MAQCLTNPDIARPQTKSVTPPPPSLALPSPSLKSSPTTQLNVASPPLPPAETPSTLAQPANPRTESYTFCTCKPTTTTPASSAERPHPPALCPSCLKTFKQCEQMEREDHHLTSFPPLQEGIGSGLRKDRRKGEQKEGGVLGFGRILGALGARSHDSDRDEDGGEGGRG